MKVNWDAAMDTKTIKMGIGFIIRDYNGVIVACLSLAEEFHSKPILVKHSEEESWLFVRN